MRYCHICHIRTMSNSLVFASRFSSQDAMLPADAAQLTPPAHVLFTEQRARTWRAVVVRPGDTLWDLASANGTTPAALVAKNRLPSGGAVIHPGQRLLGPVGGDVVRSLRCVALLGHEPESATSEPAPAPPANRRRHHVVSHPG